jgi:DNA processing protein
VNELTAAVDDRADGHAGDTETPERQERAERERARLRAVSLREDLVHAGVPERSSDERALDVERVERNIAMAHSSRIKVSVDGDKVVFETLVGERRQIAVEVAQLWDPARGEPLNAGDLRERLKPLRALSKEEITAEDAARARELGDAVGVDLDTLAALFLVESIRGFGPAKFRELDEAGVSPSEVLERPELLPTAGRRGEEFRASLGRLSPDDRQLALDRAARQIVRAAENDARLITFDHRLYPPNVRESNNPVPVLYTRGNAEVLTERRAVACVGSRQIRPPYAELQRGFAATAAREGFTVASGFALGADTISHEAAFEAGGRTVAVMPSGLDRPFPPENRPLWERLLAYEGAVFVSEFPFGTAASALTLRKRNKLIVAFASGVLVGQSSAKGGAMNAYRFALEQRKPVVTFAADGDADTSGNKLIADGPDVQQELTRSVPSAFPSRPEAREWTQWLRALSSST